MSHLTPLLSTALIGLQQQNTKAIMPAHIAPLFVENTNITPEKLFLQQVGAIDLCDQAGFIPATQQELAQFQAADATPPKITLTPDTQQNLIRWIWQAVTINENQLWLEMLQTIQEKNIGLPPQHWPFLFDLILNAKVLRLQLQAIMPPYAYWLASLKPGWKNLFVKLTTTHPNLESNISDLSAFIQSDTWQLGVKEVRLAAFKNLRMQTPDLATALLVKENEQIKSVEQAELIRVLSEQVSPMDEAFLNSQLNHRSEQVRDASRDTLRLLPNSQLVQTTQQALFKRLKPLKVVESNTSFFSKIKEKFSKPSLEIELNWPENMSELNVDFKTINIHIEPKQAQARGLSVQEFVLMQMVASVPLKAWQTYYNVSPAALLDMGSTNIWSKGISAGWLEQVLISTNAQDKVAWASAFLNKYKHSTFFSTIGVHEQIMLDCLPIEMRLQYMWDFNSPPNGQTFYTKLTQLISDLPLQFLFSAEQSIDLLKGLKANANESALQYSHQGWSNVALYLDKDTLIHNSKVLYQAFSDKNNKGAEQFLVKIQSRLDLYSWATDASSTH